jgi:TolA-binding protein
MLLLASFFAVLSYLMLSKKRNQKIQSENEVSALLKEHQSVHRDYLEVTNQIVNIKVINNLSVSDLMQKTLAQKISDLNDEIKPLEAEYKKMKPSYDKKKQAEEEEARKKRQRRARAAAATSGGFYGGYSSSSSSYSSGGSSWSGGGGGFSGGGASGSW